MESKSVIVFSLVVLFSIYISSVCATSGPTAPQPSSGVNLNGSMFLTFLSMVMVAIFNLWKQ